MKVYKWHAIDRETGEKLATATGPSKGVAMASFRYNPRLWRRPIRIVRGGKV